MLLGKPLVSTNVGIADALIPEPCELVAPADSDGLAKAIVTGLSKNSTAVRRTEERRQRAARLSNPLSTTRQLEEIFEQIFFRDGVAVRQAV
jgi:glycosyltransferase involved in cell wall biosynthesis